MSPARPAPPVPSYLSWLKDPEYQVRFLDKDGYPHWESNIGPQTWALLCPFDEIMFGGQRGGGKSSALIAWFAMGDISLPANDPARVSFLNDPSFRGLMLRQEYQSMSEFVDEAMDFYRIFDCQAKDDPTVFHFKSGAKIYTNHLGSEDAASKYKGWNITKIGLEELTQIPDQRWYLKLLGSLRAKGGVGGNRIAGGRTFRKLRTQMMSTTNPDGVGAAWVKNRFVKVLDANGVQIPRNTGMTDEITGLTRIFIPAKLDDNPYLRDDKKYIGGLLAQDDVLRAQWLEGDWEAGIGVYFRDYRPDGPLGSEEQEKYPWARHRVDPVQLQPWWVRFGSGDLGYEHLSCFHKFCRNERDHRLHVYDEIALRHTGSFELGVTLAKWWTPELEASQDHQVTMYLSPDGFAKRDETKTLVEQIEAGIKTVLGPYGAFILKYSEDERAAASRDPRSAALMFERRRQEMAGRGLMCIALKPANNNRVHGWSYIRDMMRFRAILAESETETKDRLRNLFHSAGVEAYERELTLSSHRKPEILPAIVLWKVCREADRFLREAQKDADHNPEDVLKFDAVDGVGGDDGGDSLRYGCMGYKDILSRMPKNAWISEKLSGFQESQVEAFGQEVTDPTRLAMVASTQARLYEKQNPAHGGTSVTFPRNGSRRHVQ